MLLTAETLSPEPKKPEDETNDLTPAALRTLTAFSISAEFIIPLSRTAETFLFLAALIIFLNSRFMTSVALNLTVEIPTGT